ncbi:MAG: Slp family lipoprotein [Wenzhouxiangella sp.]
MQIKNFRPLVAIAMASIALALSGCANSPLDRGGEDIAAIGPAHVLAGEDRGGERVIWGGQIAEVNPGDGYTELRIISYPLDRSDRPRWREQPGVTFVVRQPGFLEPVLYAPGRFISVLGNNQGLVERQRDDALMALPLLMAENLHLWPVDPRTWQDSPVRIGIGVGIRL